MTDTVLRIDAAGRRIATRNRRDDMPDTKRRRKLMAFLVLGVVMYGRHASVRWRSQWSCTIRTARFAGTIGVSSPRLRNYCEWLYKNKYLTALEIRHGEIDITLRELPVRDERWEEPA